MKSKLMIEPKLSPAKEPSAADAIGIQATKKKDYLRTMLSRHQLQAFVRQRGDKINYRDIPGLLVRGLRFSLPSDILEKACV
jgi:hypothetical protein